MALSKGLKQFWSLIGGLSAIGAVVSIVLICWHGMVAGGIAAVLVMMIVSAMIGNIQIQLVKAVAVPPKAEPCNLEDYDYDRSWFETHTQTLLSLGFTILTDCKLEAKCTTIGRFFYHTEHQCFTELLQCCVQDN